MVRTNRRAGASMIAALLGAGRAVHAIIRGDAPAMSKDTLSQTINFARISLIVGLVFLHYEWFPNARISPFRGLDPTQNQIATFVQSFVLFFFFSVVPLLSMISGWLFFSFHSDAAAALRSRMRRRFASLYLPLVFWNALFLAVLLLLFQVNPANRLLADMNIDLGSAGPLDYVNAVFAVTEHPIGFQFWFVRDLFVTALVSPLLWLLLTRAPLLGAVFLGGAWLIGHDLWIFFRPDVVFFFYLGGWIRLRGVPVEIGARATMVFLAAYVAMCAVRTLAPYVVDGDPFILQVMTRGMRLVGVLACWGLFQRIAPTPIGGCGRTLWRAGVLSARRALPADRGGQADPVGPAAGRDAGLDARSLCRERAHHGRARDRARPPADAVGAQGLRPAERRPGGRLELLSSPARACRPRRSSGRPPTGRWRG